LYLGGRCTTPDLTREASHNVPNNKCARPTTWDVSGTTPMSWGGGAYMYKHNTGDIWICPAALHPRNAMTRRRCVPVTMDVTVRTPSGDMRAPNCTAIWCIWGCHPGCDSARPRLHHYVLPTGGHKCQAAMKTCVPCRHRN
jgi:hypothetical protein